MDDPRINGERLWASLMEMATIGATPAGGVCRLALSDFDKEARDLFIAWCEDAGCAISVDRIGNIFARRAGGDDGLAPVVTGSHLDTQPTGGKFDGAYGVLAGLEVMRTLNDNGAETKAPFEAIAWTNEEGCRFTTSMAGSGVFAGVYTVDYIRARTDADGVIFGEELERIGYAGAEAVGGRPFAAYFEAHIEQGPFLEAENKTIGVVTGGQGKRSFEITVTGREAHAGTTPMGARRDALMGAVRMIKEVEALALAKAPDGVGTVGMIEAKPNSRNTIPGTAFFSADLRHPDPDALDELVAGLKQSCTRIAEARGLSYEMTEVTHYPATKFDEACVSAVRAAAERLGYSHRDIISRAGHDACSMARIAPAAMIFVPCENGISHAEIENATPDDLAAGCNVLLHAMLQIDGSSR